MKPTMIALIAVGGYFAWKALGLGTAAATLNIVFAGVQMNSVTNYTLNFNIQNVTNTLINLNSLAGTVYLNGTNVGNVSTFTPVGIAANDQTSINLTMDLSIFGIGTAIYNLVNTSGSVLNFEVKGNMNVSSLVLPFDVTNSVTIP